MEFGFPVLSALIFIPVVAGVLILFIPASSRDIIRGVAITSAVVTLALSALVYFSYLNAVNAGAIPQTTVEAAEGSFRATAAFKDRQFYVENIPWVPSVGISYHLGMDGLSGPMVLLTGMVAVAGVLISWQISDRQREFYSFFMLLVAGVMGVFISLDMFLLFFFYELAIFPMYILIAGWGWVKLREYAAMKLTLYILIGSVVALVGAIAMVVTAATYFETEAGAQVLQTAIAAGLVSPNAAPVSFDLVQLTLAAENGAFTLPFLGEVSFQVFWFPFIFIGFGVMAGLFPFHNWSPDGHVAAPTAVSMIHAGVLMKLGAFAALRTAVQMMPEGAQTHLPWIVFLATVNVVYGALIAFRQRDFKYVIGFSSVSHMGLVTMGWATMNAVGMTGAGLQMFSHGAMTALFFGCVGMVYDRAHTRDIPSLGGFMKILPWTGVFFIIGGLTSMGMPGFSGFVAEFPIFQGMWEASDAISLNLGVTTLSSYYSILVMLAALGIVITAAYVLRVTSQVFFGEYNRERYGNLPPITLVERVVLLLLGVPLIVLGLYPSIMAPMITDGVVPVLMLLGRM
ncbi:MAG: NADH-quinone oxidoreductase subunit M [Aggregatilineales bacterium]